MGELLSTTKDESLPAHARGTSQDRGGSLERRATRSSAKSATNDRSAAVSLRDGASAPPNSGSPRSSRARRSGSIPQSASSSSTNEMPVAFEAAIRSAGVGRARDGREGSRSAATYPVSRPIAALNARIERPDLAWICVSRSRKARSFGVITVTSWGPDWRLL